MVLTWLVIGLHCSAPGAGGLAWSSESSSSSPRFLHIAGLFPVTPRDSEEGRVGRGVIPAVELALQHVNLHPRILPGITLNLTWSDTQVTNAHFHTFFELRAYQSGSVLVTKDHQTQILTDHLHVRRVVERRTHKSSPTRTHRNW